MSKSDKNSTCDLRSFRLISLLNQFNACVASDNDSSKKNCYWLDGDSWIL